MVFWEILRRIVEKLLTDEIVVWLPKLSRYLLRRAVSCLPDAQRKKYADQWNREFPDVSGNIAPLVYALRRLNESFRLRHPHPWSSLRAKLLHWVLTVVHRAFVWVSEVWDRLFQLFYRGGGMWCQDLFN